MKRVSIIFSFLLFLISCGTDIENNSETEITTSTTEKLVIWDEIITSDFQKIFADEETISLVNKYFDIVTVDKSTIYQQSYYEAISTSSEECIDWEIEYISEKDNELSEEEVRSSAEEICLRVNI